ATAFEDAQGHRASQLGGQSGADRPSLLGDVQLSGGRAGESDYAEAEAKFAAIAVLFNESELLQRRQQSSRGRFVDPEVTGEVGDAQRSTLGQQGEDRQSSIDALAGGFGLGCDDSVAVVAHFATPRL